jgi:hypothetical protein
MDDQLLDQVASEMLQAIETKDKNALLDSLTALFTYIQQEMDESPESEMPE